MSFIIVVLCLALLIGGHRFGHSVGEAAGLGE